jgi:hypothetical protein
MRGNSFIQFAIVAAVAIASFGSSAEADIFHTWVASNGSDASATCDRTAPCATFSVALANTASGGEITCVDSGNFGSASNVLTITQSVTINCEGAIGSLNAAGGTSVGIIDVAVGATGTVTLRGLDVDGFGASGTGSLSLITFSGAGTLRLEKMRVSNLLGRSRACGFSPPGQRDCTSWTAISPTTTGPASAAASTSGRPRE